MNNLHVEIYSHNCCMDFPCAVCGRYHTQDLTAAVLLPEGKNDRRNDGYGDVCPDCLGAGPSGAASRCREYAEHLKEQAKWLYSLANDLETIPEGNWKTPEDLKAETKRIYAEMAKVDPEYKNYVDR